MSVELGILLAGGHGTRLAPMTRVCSKQLLPVHDKPLVYYPLSTLMLAGIRDILVICRRDDETAFRALLGDGSEWGLSIRYALQSEPRGVADAFRVARPIVGDVACALALGDNLFYGRGFTDTLRAAAGQQQGATVFAYPVLDPTRFGIVELGAGGEPQELVEKPSHSRSRLAVTGLYFYDRTVFERADRLRPSARGELEITDLNTSYLADGSLRVEVLGRGFTWIDVGTPEAYGEACDYVRSLESRQGWKLAVPEEIAWRMGYIDAVQLGVLAEAYPNAYGDYLRRLAGS